MPIPFSNNWNVLVALPVVAVLGCGWGGSEIAGKVTLKGNAVSSGWVTVNYPDGRNQSLSSAIQPNGTYCIRGCPGGEAKITVRPIRATVPVKKSGSAKTPTIPTRYADVEKTDLRVMLQGWSQTYDIDLKP